MVNPFIIRVLAQVMTTLTKSAVSAYKRIISENIRKGGAASNPFSEFIGKTMESANLISKPMTNTEALKILNLEGKDLTPENIIKAHLLLFGKNDPMKGGSFYIQSKIFSAKEFLMTQFPAGEEEKYVKMFEEEQKKEKAEEEEEKAGEAAEKEKKEANKEKK